MDHTRALTGIRIVFALMVVFYHLSWPGDWLDAAGLFEGRLWLRNLLSAGHVGVQFFFVLSGFILALTYHDLTPENDRSFFVARAARIYPVYLLGVVVLLPSTYLTVFRIDSEGMPPALTFTLQVVACLLLLQAWIPRWALVCNGPGWSLSVEAFFYGCFPRLIRSLREHSTATLVVATLLMLVAKQVVCWFGWHWSGIHDMPHDMSYDQNRTWWFNFWHFNPLLHIPEFISGMVAYLLLRRGVFSRGFLWWSTWIAICVLGVVMTTDVLPVIVMDNGGLVLPCALLILGLTVDSPLSRLLSTGVMQLLGQASYAVYLLHAPLLWYVWKLDARFLQTSKYPLLATVIFLVVLISLSIAVFKWFEEPMRRRIRARPG